MTAPVHLVGGGPGDPELLTLRAEELLAGADLVVADPEVAGLAPGAVVGPGPGVLVAAARAGAAVVRLYAGDPFLHPDHAGDVADLTAAGIAFEAVPGVAIELAEAAERGVFAHHRPTSVTATFGPGRVLVTGG